MEGVWMKRCPQCGAYATKSDPQSFCVCACGWDEAVPQFFCELVNKYCAVMTREDADKILAELS